MGTLREFIAMGGYGGFVWPAFGVVAVVLIGLLAVSVRGLKSKEMALATLQGCADTDRGAVE